MVFLQPKNTSAQPMQAKTYFQSLFNTFRKYALSERDKGDKFERLMEVYLHAHPRYTDFFINGWFWNDFPMRNRLESLGLP
ncbi:MAG: hypothetical protein KA138_02240 [Saprospiraceae bacterium]|nr:hypothetical protein [Saprospiraceae bacterium]